MSATKTLSINCVRDFEFNLYEIYELSRCHVDLNQYVAILSNFQIFSTKICFDMIMYLMSVQM